MACDLFSASHFLNTLRPRQNCRHFADDMLKSIFLNDWMKMYEFCVRFHWNLFLRFEFTIFQLWFRWWLGTYQATSHYLNQLWLVYRCIYASLSPNEIINAGLLLTRPFEHISVTFKWEYSNSHSRRFASYVVYKMAAILPQTQCVKILMLINTCHMECF